MSSEHKKKSLWFWLLRFFIYSLQMLLWLAVVVFVVYEMKTSHLQAAYVSRLAKDLTFWMGPGESPSIRFPATGPFDERRGYVELPSFVKRLDGKGYVVESQARFSPLLLELTDKDFFTPYHERAQAGLKILDYSSHTIFDALYPERVYSSFQTIPEVIVKSLLFIENRELLDLRYPHRNPAVDWTRLANATVQRALNLAQGAGKGPGGSTLATQIEKYRHAPEGRTLSAREKLMQMGSATLRVYLSGEETLEAQCRIILEYINSIPLGAFPGYGEIIGLGDGLWTWYGAEFEAVNRCLSIRPANAQDQNLHAWALSFKEALSLFLAQRRPALYLVQNLGALDSLTNSYIRLLAREGIITNVECDAALQSRLRLRRTMPVQYEGSFLERKTANAVRPRLLSLLEVPQLYQLDRLDLTVSSTLDARIQEDITWTLHKLRDPAYARQAGLYGYHLLSSEDPAKIIYSFTLYERGLHANLLRIQTDNYDQPLNINEGIKLELGSTAKLRTLVTYLEVVAELHNRYEGLSKAELEKLDLTDFDHLSTWAVEYLLRTPNATLPSMLNAAMDRIYSASPAESFFTGGGVHTFSNFKSEDNDKVMSVRDALYNSVNLVFIRIMRDIVRYHIFRRHESLQGPLDDMNGHGRREYLSRFADQEGQKFLRSFYSKYRGKSTDEAIKTLLSGISPSPVRLAVIFRTVMPEAGLKEFNAFMNEHLPSSELSAQTIQKLYERYAEHAYSLVDRGFLAHVHPLELWTVAYLQKRPKATQSEIVRDSAGERQAVYTWLFKTSRKETQDTRIQIVMENEAFQEIHRSWKRLGYPFDSLVPSYATAIGSSADRPAALAELVGIILNAGYLNPSSRIEKLHFAKDTPYETVIKPREEEKEQVLLPEIALVVRRELAGVVEHGTATRAYKVFLSPDGSPITVGGKTGTGDNRRDIYNQAGDLIQSKVINRTATFVFYIGNRFFGTITAYVAGPEAADYNFTSTLPVQVLRTLAPKLMPLINGTETSRVTDNTTISSTAETPEGVGH